MLRSLGKMSFMMAGSTFRTAIGTETIGSLDVCHNKGLLLEEGRRGPKTPTRISYE